MQIVKRTMGWYQKPSAWQHQQSLNAKRREQAQSYLNQTNLLATSIFSVKDTFNHDMTALILKATANRVTSEAEARVQESLPDNLLDDLKAKLDTTA